MIKAIENEKAIKANEKAIENDDLDDAVNSKQLA